MLSTKSLSIDYGNSGINVEVPIDRTTVIRPVYKNGLKNAVKEINRVINSPINSEPLSKIQKPGMKVSISICDVTRAQPRVPILESILKYYKNHKFR